MSGLDPAIASRSIRSTTSFPAAAARRKQSRLWILALESMDQLVKFVALLQSGEKGFPRG